MKTNIEAGGVALQEFLTDKALTVEESAAGQQETIVFSSGEFAKLVETAYSCDYDITGFWAHIKYIIYLLIKFIP